MPKLDLSKLEARSGSIYPAPYDAEMEGRSSLRVGDAGGLTQFGANIVILAPGAKSSLRHWHVEQDDFVMITQGSCTLVDDHGETQMTVGDCATFPANDGNGHHFINNTAKCHIFSEKNDAHTRPYHSNRLMWRVVQHR